MFQRLSGWVSAAGVTSALVLGAVGSVSADETCVSPYSPKIVGQEDYVYVWTLGVEGMGDEQDKLVSIDANPDSPTYGKVLHSVSVGGRNEAHHSGYSDDRRYLWAGGLDTNKIFIFDVHTDPAKPSLFKVIDDFVAVSGGVVGPHSFYALPGRMMISALSNNADHGGRTALVEYSNEGDYVATHWMPTDDDLQGAEKTGQFADGYGYDVRFLPAKNLMVTSSFTGWSNYMMDFGKMLNDPEAMKRFGNTAAVWDLHARKPLKVFDVPGAPLEIRCAWGSNYCFTTTALTSKIWLIYEDKDQGWTAKEVGTIGDPSKVPLPVAFSISADDRFLWVNTFMDGSTRLFDVSDPFDAKLVDTFKIGSQVNMVSQSWDGERLYFTSSLLANWDKKGEDDQQFLKMYHWDGKQLSEGFTVDFYKEKLGRAHLITLNSRALYASKIAESSTPSGRVGALAAVSGTD
ncbi:selenium-binding protein, putative [Thiorhodococcus drewsii AZ1]|uniref:Methanethiol oxidase n=1 Tax=Thiorhodococcus drewsii AZ1 TaxID=765913 RepID=G2DWY1_9GAMM|nr:selenium-binding protein SBP56-related protein [Thiorhodococcus drewsii]EGV33335.1 selenium-binding protein, putative [Thiorhodococcus drewsii AZ1]